MIEKDWQRQNETISIPITAVTKQHPPFPTTTERRDIERTRKTAEIR